jgi:hypothetical protein
MATSSPPETDTVAIGSMDYANGFITQWLHPQVDSGGLDPTFLSVFLATHSLMQLGVVYILFRKDVIDFFCYSNRGTAAGDAKTEVTPSASRSKKSK